MKEKVNPAKKREEALANYKATTEFLSSIGNQLQDMMGKENFSTEVLLRQYDYALQLVLFKTMIADGVIAKEELEFIQSIAEHGDILDLVNNAIGNGREALTWEDLEEADVKTMASFSQTLDEITDDVLDNFLETVAFVDAHGSSPDGMISDVTGSIGTISEDLAAADGLIEGSEKVEIFKSLLSSIKSKYDDAKAKISGRA